MEPKGVLSVVVFLTLSVVCVRGTSVAFCDNVDLTFVVDQSESLREEDPYNEPDHTWNLVKTFIKGLISKLPVSQNEVNVALVKYASHATLEWGLNTYSYPDELFAAVDALTYQGGNTNTAEALRLTYNQIYQFDRRFDARNVIVLLSDGMSTIQQHLVPTEAVKLFDNNIEIYAVAVGKYVDEDELKEIVQKRYGQYLIYVDSYDTLPDFEDLLANRICNRKPLPPKGGECTRKMDLTFLVDSSGSIKANTFEGLKDFLVLLISYLEIGPDKTRVAAVTFSDNATVSFGLGDYRDEYDLNNKLRNLLFENGNTNTSGAIRVAAQEVYSGNKGDRPDVSDVVLLVTDGSSTVESNSTIPEANSAKLRGIQMFAIGVTHKVNVQELHQIVSPPIREHYFDSTDVHFLNSVLISLLKNICMEDS